MILREGTLRVIQDEETIGVWASNESHVNIVRFV